MVDRLKPTFESYSKIFGFLGKLFGEGVMKVMGVRGTQERCKKCIRGIKIG
jgi:hypothetical protein